MRLRNKKTGEIIDIYKGEITLRYNQGRKTIHFKSLEELEEWENVPEEPKVYYWIDYDGKVKSFIDLYEWQDKMKEIGNYFATKEEAEKVVEKLKAWKRLTDKGFRFCGYTALGLAEIHFMVDWEDIDVEQHTKDLDLLFGGEE